MAVTRTRSEPEPRSTAAQPATLDDLYGVDGKAELIGGRIVPIMPTGRYPNRIAFRITRSLDDHANATGRGEAYVDNRGFAVPRLASGRESFSPDASFYEGPMPANRMRFLTGPPTFAVEVRSENDYGPAAEAGIAAKRADYFEAGTQVVWDVDPVSEQIRAFEPKRQTSLCCSDEVRSLTPSRPFPVGESRLIKCSVELTPNAQERVGKNLPGSTLSTPQSGTKSVPTRERGNEFIVAHDSSNFELGNYSRPVFQYGGSALPNWVE